MNHVQKDEFRRNASRVLQEHYAHILNGRRLTDKEIAAELSNLRRKEAKGALDDSGERLYSAIFKYTTTTEFEHQGDPRGYVLKLVKDGREFGVPSRG